MELKDGYGKKQTHFPAVLHIKPSGESLSKEEAIDMIDALDGSRFFPVEVFVEHWCAIGFVTAEFRKKLKRTYEEDTEYGILFENLVKLVLSDSVYESADGRYDILGETIWMVTPEKES